MSSIHKVLIDGSWRPSDSSGTFQAINPVTKEPIAEDYPVSCWSDCDAALDAATRAFEQLRSIPAEKIAVFLESFATRIEARTAEICALANLETALPVEPRLAPGELPRTTGQLRQAANAARTHSWRQPTIDTATNIRSCYSAIGPVAVFGPNNFPLAFGSISGGDFAAAIAAGNPVIAKGNPMHPGTTRLLAEEAVAAAQETGMPQGIVQLIYDMDHADGHRLAQDPRLAAIAFTGSRNGGLKLKASADQVGKPIYLELSSVNPIVVLPAALTERGDDIATELAGSCLMGTGQFCTNPGLVLLPSGSTAESFTTTLSKKFQDAGTGTLFSQSGQDGLASSIDNLKSAGAELICGGESGGGAGFSYRNTVLQVSGEKFLINSEALQAEAFGNTTLLVKYDGAAQLKSIIESLEGNLTGCIYSATTGDDDQDYDTIAPSLRQRVGRLINDKMPTGVAVSPAMNHGGPYPATGHPGFTSVGIPGSLVRFSMLQCFDNVRAHRLPELLRDENSHGYWRLIDGQWTTSDAHVTANA